MSSSGGVESTANITDIHEPLHFDVTEEHDNTYRCCNVLLLHARLMVLQWLCCSFSWTWVRVGAVHAVMRATAEFSCSPCRAHKCCSLAHRHTFGIWSLRWSSDGSEVIAGTGDHSLYVYSMERQLVCQQCSCLSPCLPCYPCGADLLVALLADHVQSLQARMQPSYKCGGLSAVPAKKMCMLLGAQTTLRIAGHDDDVNAVVFLDAGSHLIATGSDDSLIKVCLPWPLLPPPLVRQSCCGLCIQI